MTAVTVEARRERTIALARLGAPDASAALIGALRDPDATVRAAAVMGLGALERDAPEPAVSALLSALAAEVDVPLRSQLLWSLGRTGSETAWPALTDGLAAESALVRSGACRGIGAAGLVGSAVPEATLLRAATRVVDDPDVTVRRDCAHAVGRSPATESTAADLARGTTDPEPSVRGLAVRALGRLSTAPLDALVAAARDPDPFVALAGMRTLVTRDDSAAVYATRLRELAVSASTAPDSAWPGVLLAALEAPTPTLARDPAIVTATTELLGGWAAAPHERAPALLHCAASRLLDLAAGVASLVDACGLGVVTVSEQAVIAAEVVGASPWTTAASARLELLAAHDSEVVREAAAAAAGEHDEALPILRRLLDDPDLGVRISAVDATGALLARARAAGDAATLDALLTGTPTTAAGPASLLDDDLRALLRAALEAFATADDLEGLVTTASTFERAADATLATHLGVLAAHHNVAVRRAVRSALEAADVADAVLDAAPRASPPHLITPETLVLEARRARVETERGVFVIALWPEVAPTTVSRFTELADAHDFDGLAFHRVVPGFVVQGGDPRGDGYGGPGWSQRCEDNLAAYDRGVVGMALAGRDTGGSQFFVTITPQPHLDGRYTAFGRVVEGMDVVDQLLRGDVIRSVTVERGTPATAPTLAPEPNTFSEHG